jgi:hypothetical protein
MVKYYIIIGAGSVECSWEWIVQKLRDQFNTRNYNRAVDVPEYVMPEYFESLTKKLEKI